MYDHPRIELAQPAIAVDFSATNKEESYVCHGRNYSHGQHIAITAALDKYDATEKSNYVNRRYKTEHVCMG